LDEWYSTFVEKFSSLLLNFRYRIEFFSGFALAGIGWSGILAFLELVQQFPIFK
jgi:hypothetical protein